MCDCSSASGSGGSSATLSSGTTMVGSCGDGIKQESDKCDSPGSEFYCMSDCTLPGTGGAGTGGNGTGGATTSTGTGGDPCAGVLLIKQDATFAAAPSDWSLLPSAGGVNGLEAGNNQCKSKGADHVCDYEELLKAQANGEFANIAATTTAWIHRTTTAKVNGVDSAPGPGGRCNDWFYSTNHISDGEFVSFAAGGVPTYNLDADTVFNAATPHVQAGLDCGGVTRTIFCCNVACK